MPTNDGGAAFPCGYHRDGNSADQAGMTLRDWFAGQASEEDVRHWQSVMAANDMPVSREESKYVYADRMLAARERER